MKLIYICSPLSGDLESNKKKANEYCANAAIMGVIPLAPHTIFTQYLDDTLPIERQKGLQMGLTLLKRCDELWVCGSIISEGMRGEISFAAEHGIPTHYFPCLEMMVNLNDIGSLTNRVAAAKEAVTVKQECAQKSKEMEIC